MPTPVFFPCSIVYLFCFHLSFVFSFVKEPERTAIVSFMSKNNHIKQERSLQRMRELFLYSLRHVAGYTGEILFLVGDGLTDHEDMEIFNRYKAKTKHVEIIRARKPNRNYLIMTNHYGTQLTKLHLWALVEYDQIIYYDNDFTFFKDPSSCLHVCGTAPLCAVTDTSLTPKRPFLLVPIGSRTRLVNQDFSFLVI